jgi:hypothetical protein
MAPLYTTRVPGISQSYMLPKRKWQLSQLNSLQKQHRIANISATFQLSGCGDGFTFFFEIVVMVPIYVKKLEENLTRAINFRFYSNHELAEKRFTIVEDSNNQDHKWREVELPYQHKKYKTKLLTWIV